jgi:hypothetical protein
MPTTDDYIAAAMSAFRARRGEKIVSAGGRTMTVHTPGQRILYLPNGAHVNVRVDDSGVATQVEEDDALHAIVRPHPIQLELRMRRADRTVASRVRPRSIRTTAIPRR